MKYLFRCLIAMIACTTAHPAEFHVAPTGDDAAAGTADAPFASLHRARDAVRALKTEAGTIPEDGITVWLHDGDYILQESVALNEEDGGAAWRPVRYRAAPDARPRLLGGAVLPASAFQPVHEPAARARLDAAARDQVRVIDLAHLGIADLGEFPRQFTAPPPVPELFFNGERMALARWPNDGWAEVERVVESGPAPWRNHESDMPVGTFVYSGDRPSRWTSAPAVWLEGYWCFDWACETILMGKLDPRQREITLAEPHHYGLGSGNRAPRRFRAINLLEELDAPGEYYIDREQRALYFWPPSSLDGSEILLSLLESPLVTVENADHLVFQGLTFDVSRGTGMTVRGGQEVRIVGCTLRNTGYEAIRVEGGYRHQIVSCEIYDTGTDGIVLHGGDCATLTPAHHEVVNNHLHHVSSRRPTAAYHIQVIGVGARVAHNELHDAPHQSILLHGNDHLIEYNEVYEIARHSDDCGAFYMGRNPAHQGNVIRYNYWRNIGSDFSHGSAAVYLDDGTVGQHIYGNVFYRASGGSFGAVFIHGGHDNLVEHNIFIESSRAVGHAPWNESTWEEWVRGDLWQQRLLRDVDIMSPRYTGRYPALRGFFELPGPPRQNHLRGNLIYRCEDVQTGNWTDSNNWVTDEDPGFVDAAAEDFRLREAAPVFDKIEGFPPPPFEKMGRYDDGLQGRALP